MRPVPTLGVRVRAVYYYLAIICTVMAYASWAILLDALGMLGSRGKAIVQRGAQMILRLVPLQVSVGGQEHVPMAGGLLVVGNHESHMDGVVLEATFPRELSIVAKEELFHVPIFGRGLRAVDFVAINRDSPRQAVTTMNAAADFCRDGGVLLVFPEGTRSEDGEIQEFKRGAAQLAIKAGVPVLPLAISGTRAVLPAHSLVTIPGPVHVEIGPPLQTAELSKADRTAFTQSMEDAVRDCQRQARAALAARDENSAKT